MKRGADVTIEAFFNEHYLTKLRLQGSSPATIEKYGTLLQKLWLFCGCRDPLLSDLTDVFAEKFLADQVARGLAAASVNILRAELLAIWRHAFKRRLVEEPPRDVGRVREMKREPRAWTIDELARILDEAGRQPGWLSSIPACLFMPALIRTLFETGLRVGALVRVPLQAYERERRWLAVPGEVQKQKSDQVFRISELTCAAIDATLAGPRGLLFPISTKDHKRYRANGKAVSKLYEAYSDILERCGLPATDSDKFHKVRRTTASYVAAAADPETARKVLGHSSVAVTNRYLDPRLIPARVQALDLIPRLDAGQ